jgi:hypothetical protein
MKIIGNHTYASAITYIGPIHEVFRNEPGCGRTNLTDSKQIINKNAW